MALTDINKRYLGIYQFYQLLLTFHPRFQQNCYIIYLLVKTIKISDLALKVLKANDNKIVNGDSSKANKMVVNLSNKSKNNKSRNLMHMPNIKAKKEPIFLNLNIKKTIDYLQLAFIKALIF